MKLLITGAWQNAKDHFAEIEKLGHEIVFLQWEKDEIPCSYEDIEGVICNGLFLHHPIERFKNLRYIQLTSAGFDRVPMEYVKSHNIEIHNARGVYSIPMAEFAVCGVLQLYKQSSFFMQNQKTHRWEKNRNITELFGKTVCIVGCGSVGTECAIRFKAFGCEIIGVDIAPKEDGYYSQMVEFDKLNDVLPNADVIVLTLPLTDETRFLINRERISQMRSSAILVNIARGAIVDTANLIEAMKKERLGGAVLDVFEEEPLTNTSLLWNLDRVIISPHCSFISDENKNRILQIIMSNLKSRRD